MRNAPVWAALAIMACAVPSVDTKIWDAPAAIAYAAETDLAIDRAITTSQYLGRDADVAHEAALDTLRQRTDASERLVARVEQQPDHARMPYLLLLAHVSQSAMSTQYLTGLALRLPVPEPRLPGQHNDARTEYERTLGEGFAAVNALVRQGNRDALRDIYANAHLQVAAVAAGYASQAGILDDGDRQMLNGRGITGSFQPMNFEEVLNVPDATLGPSVVAQPEGPQ